LQTQITDYHAKYYAYELSRNGGSGFDRLGRALFDACVDLNPHQIEAALFALRSPIAKGALLADEVGLGKTIEAGLVLCQYWAERRRKLLVICPASIRKQWAMELSEKFNLPYLILDAKTFKNNLNNGNPNPFYDNSIIICSMHYAAAKADLLKDIAWDLVVIDEAHKLRNAYRQSNRIGQALRWATEGHKKLLLTATPLQNSLLELYGLSTLIDERLFGDISSFKTQYINYGGDLAGLRERIKYFCKRTLRSQVSEYIRYTERKLVTRPFNPSEQEHTFYQAISTYLQREDTYAFPKAQRHLLVLLLRKILASSPYAVAGTLEIIKERLIRLLDSARKNTPAISQLICAEEIDDDLLDELLEDEEDDFVSGNEDSQGDHEIEKNKEVIDLKALAAEIDELSQYITWARSIGIDTKTKALLKAVEIGFSELEKMGAAKKVVIFTESRRTQAWLKNYLDGNGYAGKVLTFNGTNTDEASTQIYNAWLHENEGTGRTSGSKQIDIRYALIDYFKQKAEIMIATEAGAEGLNLQFCSAVINYDLPWNPQRIEQRIGRCHRYGQNHDVVVINFLNKRNEADQRVYELLEHKFRLFSGVFGASDEVLGTIESGIDFERRVLEIYQSCRTEEEIQSAFLNLQTMLDDQIQSRISDTRKLLLEHFDEDVHERLRFNISGAQEKLDRISKMFWDITKHTLNNFATFNDSMLTFTLNASPVNTAKPGKYYLISKSKENILGNYLYRLSHPLGEFAIDQGKNYQCPPGEVVFDISNHPTRISIINNLVNKSGWLYLQHLDIESFDQEDCLLFSAVDDQGQNLDQEACEKMFHCKGQFTKLLEPPIQVADRLISEGNRHLQAAIAKNLEENNKHFIEARDQLDKWADDMELAAQKELDQTKHQIRDLQRRSRQAPTIDEQHQLQQEIATLERKKRQLREKIFDLEDEIAEKRDQLVDALEKRMLQKTKVNPLFIMRWRVI
jgi:superfamily II DNA or RNA helicase